MAERTVLTDIPFRADLPLLLKMLHLENDGEDARQVQVLVREAERIARPKAVYTVAYIDDRSDDGVVLDGIAFKSRVLRVNLEQAQRVFAYVATAGTELADWAAAKTDIMERYWADGIMLTAVRAAMAYLGSHLEQRYRPGPLARMNPGSLQDWPLPQQRQLFALIGGVYEDVGVRLTDSYLMVPSKSVSGIQFPTQETFESCQLCGREGCPGRRAPYDPALYERKYAPGSDTVRS